jgi:hypothetical protein
LLVVSDLYGFHVLNSVGAFNSGLSGAQLQEADSCLSGHYFHDAFASNRQVHLEASDEDAVNKFLAAEGAPAGSTQSQGAATADQLTNSFNKGATAPEFKTCLPGQT